MSDILRAIGQLFAENVFATVVSVAVTVAGTMLAGYFWNRKRWKNKTFAHRIHFGINTIEKQDGAEPKRTLVFDSLFETGLGNVVDDPVARGIIARAMKKTNAVEPFLRLDPEDREHIEGAIKIAIAQTCQQGTIAKMALGNRCQTLECVFAITYEKYAEMRSRKLRVIIVPRSLLEDPKTFLQKIELERRHHSCRLTTLKEIQQDWREGKRFTASVRINHST